MCRVAVNLLLAVHPDGDHSTPAVEDAIRDDLPPIHQLFSAEAIMSNRDAFNYHPRVTDMYYCFEMLELVLAGIDISFREKGEYTEIIWMAAAVYGFCSREINTMLDFYEDGVDGENSDQSMEMDYIDDGEWDEMLEPLTPEMHY